MKKQNTYYATSLLILLFSISFARAQSFTDGLHLGIKFGGAQFLGETGSDISGRLEEFNNTFGMATDIEVSKYLTDHIEFGIEIGSSSLLGNTDDPQFSAEGIHYTMFDGIEDPVEYETKLLSQKAFLSFYLRNVSSESNGIYINPFVRVGVGHLFYKAKFKYQNAPSNEIIFGKGINDHHNLTTAVYNFGTGVKATVSENISLMASVMFNYVTHDFLDAVYNYTPSGERMNLSGLYSEFKIGVFYSFGKGTSKKSPSKNKSVNKRGGRSRATNGHLPFAR